VFLSARGAAGLKRIFRAANQLFEFVAAGFAEVFVDRHLEHIMTRYDAEPDEFATGCSSDGKSAQREQQFKVALAARSVERHDPAGASNSCVKGRIEYETLEN
jgi:hypothetical protein